MSSEGETPSDEVESGTEETQSTEEKPIFERDKEKKLIVSIPNRRRWSKENPIRFTPDTALQIIKNISVGMFLGRAATEAGINEKVFKSWRDLANGEAKDEQGNTIECTREMRAFGEQLAIAEARAEVSAVSNIRAAGVRGIWQADAWFLERRFHERWGQKSVVDHRSADGSMSPPKEAAKPMTSEQMIREAAKMLSEFTEGAPNADDPGTKGA